MADQHIYSSTSPKRNNSTVSDKLAPKTTTDKRCSISINLTGRVSPSASGGEEGSVESTTSGVNNTNYNNTDNNAVITTNSGRVPRKFITTWKHACDKTKDRTKDLFKRWRTLPETATDGNENEISTKSDENRSPNQSGRGGGWSVHVWATWVKRYPYDDEDMMMFDDSTDCMNNSSNVTDFSKHLTEVQKEKFEHLFRQLFDNDNDDLISVQDFDSFCEKLRHFADWTENSTEFLTLTQVKDGFIEHFIILPQSSEDKDALIDIADIRKKPPHLQVIALEEWLAQWGKMLLQARSFQDFPIWLQYLPKILFEAINTSNNGIISYKELCTYYSVLLGITTEKDQMWQKAYRAMTANSEYPLTYSIFRLCFANFLLGRFPNGPGQYVFGYAGKSVEMFPIDYSAMNTPIDQLEQYTPDKKSNRRSVVV